MKFIHLSDTHGRFPELPDEGEFIVHSGDFLPDCPRIGVEPLDFANIKYQRNWLGKRVKRLKEWLKGRPFFYSAGNHDPYRHVCADMRARGIETYDITHTYAEYKGIRFHGFPYVPKCYGRFAFEQNDHEMNDRMFELHNKFIEYGMPDIFVTHCPPFGILDLEDGVSVGNKSLRNYIENIWKDNKPKWLLSGHCHQTPGIIKEFNINVSQAATKINILEF